MTCIVGYVDSDGVLHMGGDSAGINQQEGCVVTIKHPKVFENGEFLMGYTTSFRFGQLLQHAFKPKHLAGGADIMQYMVTEFADSLRDTLRTHGYFSLEGNEFGGIFLVGIRGKLFTMHEDFHLEEHAEPYAAIGGGRQFALGAMHAMESMSKPIAPDVRVVEALRAAAQFSCMVRGPFTLIRKSRLAATESRVISC